MGLHKFFRRIFIEKRKQSMAKATSIMFSLFIYWKYVDMTTINIVTRSNTFDHIVVIWVMLQIPWSISHFWCGKYTILQICWHHVLHDLRPFFLLILITLQVLQQHVGHVSIIFCFGFSKVNFIVNCLISQNTFIVNSQIYR